MVQLVHGRTASFPNCHSPRRAHGTRSAHRDAASARPAPFKSRYCQAPLPAGGAMKFERLRLHGFKSFCDETVLVMEPGLTGIVGPNGCGKSNLVEAMRWVMGENSYKAMRASGMDD